MVVLPCEKRVYTLTGVQPRCYLAAREKWYVTGNVRLETFLSRQTAFSPLALLVTDTNHSALGASHLKTQRPISCRQCFNRQVQAASPRRPLIQYSAPPSKKRMATSFSASNHLDPSGMEYRTQNCFGSIPGRVRHPLMASMVKNNAKT